MKYTCLTMTILLFTLMGLFMVSSFFRFRSSECKTNQNTYADSKAPSNSTGKVLTCKDFKNKMVAQACFRTCKML